MGFLKDVARERESHLLSYKNRETLKRSGDKSYRQDCTPAEFALIAITKLVHALLRFVDFHFSKGSRYWGLSPVCCILG